MDTLSSIPIRYLRAKFVAAGSVAVMVNHMEADVLTTAIQKVCARHLHQCFWLPASDIHDRLRVTYSTTSNFADTSLPVILFCSPMFGNRYMNLLFEQLARTSRVRVICIDRPGTGGSSRVSLKLRVQIWLQAVPVLLAHLDVQHINLVCHSAGTIYALNTLFHLRHLLSPTSPYFAIMCPWVHYEHSNASLLTLAAKLPNGMLDGLNSLAKFGVTKLAPTISWSGGLLTPITKLWSSPQEVLKENHKLTVKYGSTAQVATMVEKLMLTYAFAEDTTGSNEDARLCLKMTSGCDWGCCENYKLYVQNVIKQERERRRSTEEIPVLKIRSYFAASDVMIGDGGQLYFESCWNSADVHELIDYKSRILSKTDHDSVLTDLDDGALLAIFRDVSQCGTV